MANNTGLQEALAYLVDHIFLPPKIPSSDKAKFPQDGPLISIALRSLTEFQQHGPPEALTSALAAMENMAVAHDLAGTITINKSGLTKALENLHSDGASIPLHVVAQNAGIIITKVKGGVTFDVFELSPTRHSAMKTRLCRSFPASSIAVPDDEFNHSFRVTLAATLAKMSSQPVFSTDFVDNITCNEYRETTHPKLVTNFLVATLLARGDPAKSISIRKNTREDVIFQKDELPWTRSPTWLMIRVTLQLTMARANPDTKTGILYKEFMIFFLADILKQATKVGFDSELLYIMHAKLHRRLCKVRDCTIASRAYAYDAMRDALGILRKRWDQLQRRDDMRIDLSAMNTLKTQDDAKINLPDLDSYLTELANRTNSPKSMSFQPRFIMNTYAPGRLPDLEKSTEQSRDFDLLSFEAWVALHLNNWLEANISRHSTCQMLAEQLYLYHNIAVSVYKENPESMSILVLTLIDLWIACDRAAVVACPLLEDYDPGVDPDLLQSLLLPLMADHQRLQKIETYLGKRESRSRYKAPHIFTAHGKSDCFSVRWFQTSQSHKTLMADIKTHARYTGRLKEMELEDKKLHCWSLNLQSSHSAHVGGERLWDAEANSMRINVYEWPLPKDELEAQSVVFELAVPPPFGHWRDVTLFVKRTGLKGSYRPATEGHQRRTFVQHHPELSKYFVSFSERQRDCLAVWPDPKHSGPETIHVRETTSLHDVFVWSRESYGYYDIEAQSFLGETTFSDGLGTSCMYKMPTVSKDLQQFLRRTAQNPRGPPPNTVMATLHQCPEHFTIEEYKALCTIPLGNMIQWHNILVQLHAPSVDFNKVETLLTLLQCVLQAGPPKSRSTIRLTHFVVTEPRFARPLLKGLYIQLQHIKSNWQAVYAIIGFISIACRLIAITSDQATKDGCLKFLDNCRSTTMDWYQGLQQEVRGAITQKMRDMHHSKMYMIALICSCTFELDSNILVSILASPKHASILLRCSIAIHEGEQLVGQDAVFLAILKRRWQRVLFRSWKIISDQIVQQQSNALDDAIQLSWPVYKTANNWAAVETHTYWLRSSAVTTDNSEKVQVHFNLLTGELLVNGNPLGRLPVEYRSHDIYREMFGYATFEVLPSNMPGMEYLARSKFHGYSVHFGLSQDNPASGPDLLLRISSGTRSYELLPRRLLRGHYPSAFIEKHVHWYDITGQSVKFRALSSPWKLEEASWTLLRPNSGLRWHLHSDGRFVLAARSPTARLLAKALRPLEDSPFIHCILHKDSLVEVQLDRLHLEFYVERDSSQLASRQYRGMIIDENQSLGTFIGLRDKLVLISPGKLPRRVVLIPFGQASCERSEGHVQVTIDTSNMKRKRVETYSIDTMLGRVLGCGSHESRLFQSYLHALTSFCLPDPLLHRTGTEEALSILSSAAVGSFMTLSKTSCGILQNICRLSPSRRWCHPDKKVMQTVDWSKNLGFMAQHGRYYTETLKLFDHHNKMKIFDIKDPEKLSQTQPMDTELRERDNIRSSTFRTVGFGAESFSSACDAVYHSRGSWEASPQAIQVFAISSFVLGKSSKPSCEMPAALAQYIRKYMGHKTIDNSTSTLSTKLQYDASWVLESGSFLAENWLNIHNLLSRSRSSISMNDIAMWMAALAYGDSSDMPILYTLASFYTLEAMKAVTVAKGYNFRPGKGDVVNESELGNAIFQLRYDLPDCPEARLVRRFGERTDDFERRKGHTHYENTNDGATDIMRDLKSQWPCSEPKPLLQMWRWNLYYNIDQVMRAATPKFMCWYQNTLLWAYLTRLARLVSKEQCSPHICSPTVSSMPQYSDSCAGFISFEDIFKPSAPLPDWQLTSHLGWLLLRNECTDASLSTMEELMRRLKEKAACRYEVQYVQELESSSEHLRDISDGWRLPEDISWLPSGLETFRYLSQLRVSRIYSAILKSIDFSQAVAQSGAELWPRVGPLSFLQQLSRNKWARLSDHWKACIVEYGLALATLQQAERMVSCGVDSIKLVAELQNPGHTNWDPKDNPESLLLEIENSIMIREVQEEMATQMREPKSGKNEISQLIMGGGKSSVIVPAVAARLADGKRLVRVIVAKPQAKQMFSMLVEKLGGLIDRRVFMMPFSRSVKLQAGHLGIMQRLYDDCLSNGGVLLMQPEHILSFQLMAIEKHIAKDLETGHAMLKILRFLHNKARDIIDESDENFSIKFELVYTLGKQRDVDQGPSRWTCIQEALEVCRTVIPAVQARFPDSIEVYPGPVGCFQRTRLLGQDAVDYLVYLVSKHICENGLTGFPIIHQPESVRRAVCNYIQKPLLSESEVEFLDGGGDFVTNNTKDMLYLLRGLLAGRVLPFVFSRKRWRVDYGLDKERPRPTKLAVPYRAKDVPSARSEFSHPDIVIALTSLSYYYGGLADEDMFACVRHLQRSNQADIEYQAWIKDADNLSPSFRQLGSINLEDSRKCIRELFPALCRGKSVVDYFLSNLVFPQEMKEFPSKLSASGWDIGESRSHPTTGFSGTNDSHIVLPLSITQENLDTQVHTNALVLRYLLQPENTVAIMPNDAGVISSEAERLLDMVVEMTPAVRVILDVGALILELDNKGFASKWLNLVADDGLTEAVVFVNQDDELCVLNRRGQVELLQTSHFATQLDRCLVFLDEVHTRGTDLVLPSDYRAAVTLGANLTKDRLVQACMRMRKLGHGQSVVFCAPKEIRLESNAQEPTVLEVLEWAVRGTWEDAARSLSLWAAQGRRHSRQSKLWDTYRDGTADLSMSREHAKKFMEDEAMSIEARYGPIARGGSSITAASHDSDPITLRFNDFVLENISLSVLSEEQERELSPEVEREREVQRAESATPAVHYLHPDIEAYIWSGLIGTSSEAYQPAFLSLPKTIAAKHRDGISFPRNIMASRDFARTVMGQGSGNTQRSVQWVITSRRFKKDTKICTALILSPYEAQELLPSIHKSLNVTLHLYAPRPNLGYQPLDNLDLYTVPDKPIPSIHHSLITELNLFAGQLYFGSATECVRVCRFIGITNFEAMRVAILKADDDKNTGFVGIPIKFLQIFFSQVRRSSGVIGKTHMGQLLDYKWPPDLDSGSCEEGRSNG
ncbi:hypothetical protein NLG97_g4066 [Lecanicillium saksenae]|uniref:Uncharacterized protein n=1 Tax=Lecanicillium saksenae TaxID=468837 RepID=A0ACC1QYZ8_9HYPO|nr:hypothetical protein NLG97_g4066 [Lecanicillium saksenae]